MRHEFLGVSEHTENLEGRGGIETVRLEDYLDGGILREVSFRGKVAATNWGAYQGKRVLIKGCSDVPIPTWAYLVVSTRLAQHADHILYGEACAAIKLFNREKDHKELATP